MRRNYRPKHLKPIITIRILSIKELFVLTTALSLCMFLLGSFTNEKDPPQEDTPATYQSEVIPVEPVIHNTSRTINHDRKDVTLLAEPLVTLSAAVEIEEEEDPPMEQEEIEPIEEEIIPEEPVFDLESEFGMDLIETPDGHTLTRFDTPDVYHPGIDYWSVQTWMPYTVITAKSSAAYWVAHSDSAYTDDNGFRRYTVDDSEFTINDHEDDFMIALGTYYKPKGTCGSRWLIVTDNGSYTAITGDEKSDLDTDPNHQYKPYGKYANVIEFLIDRPALCNTVKSSGSATSMEKFSGKILYIYRID